MSFDWLLNQITAAITNEKDVMYLLSYVGPSSILVQWPVGDDMGKDPFLYLGP